MTFLVAATAILVSEVFFIYRWCSVPKNKQLKSTDKSPAQLPADFSTPQFMASPYVVHMLTEEKKIKNLPLTQHTS